MRWMFSRSSRGVRVGEGSGGRQGPRVKSRVEETASSMAGEPPSRTLARRLKVPNAGRTPGLRKLGSSWAFAQRTGMVATRGKCA